MKLISATPYVTAYQCAAGVSNHSRSPYARKVRITLAEKGVPFELQTEVPWNSTTKTKDHNPLEKLPVLIPEKGDAAYNAHPDPVYESYYILEWLEAYYPPPKYYGIYPSSKADELLAKQVQVVSDGMCDACVQMFFERQRDAPSKEWTDRQMRKVRGGLKALNDWVGNKEFILENRLTLADIAAGGVLGYMKVRFQAIDWQSEYPGLKKYIDRLEERQSFKDTVPVPQNITDKIV